MGQEHIQTRVPDALARRIDNYQEQEGFMNRAETVRHLLRQGLDAGTTDEPTDGGSVPDHLRPAWRAAGWLSHGTLALYLATLLVWLLSVPVSVVPLTAGVVVSLVAGIVLATAGTILTLTLTVILLAVGSETGGRATVGRLDLRRVVT